MEKRTVESIAPRHSGRTNARAWRGDAGCVTDWMNPGMGVGWGRRGATARFRGVQPSKGPVGVIKITKGMNACRNENVVKEEKPPNTAQSLLIAGVFRSPQILATFHRRIGPLVTSRTVCRDHMHHKKEAKCGRKRRRGTSTAPCVRDPRIPNTTRPDRQLFTRGGYISGVTTHQCENWKRSDESKCITVIKLGEVNRGNKAKNPT